MEKELLIRFLKCATTPDEEARIAQWLEADPANRRELDALGLMLEGLALCAPEVKARDAERRRRRSFLLRRIRRISAAAAAVVVLTAGLSYGIVSNVLERWSDQVTVVEVPLGQRTAMTLADGTRVWLNAGTRLEYPSVFARDERRVRVSGEAMFDVAKDEEHPFVVETFACDVEVLGTKFNVRADEERELFSTALFRGRVQVTNRLTGGDPVVLAPDDEVRLVGGRLCLEKIGDRDLYLWPEGVISIRGLDFAELMRTFERAYGVRIEIRREELPEVRFNRGKIRVSDGVDHALRMLQQAADFTYEKDPRSDVITIL